MIQSKILIIDDDENILRTFSTILGNHGYVVHKAEDYESAMAAISQTRFDVIFADIILEERSGIDILKDVKTLDVDSPVIMITGEPEIETAAAAVRYGAFDYIAKPIYADTLIRVTKHAIQYKAFQDEKETIERENKAYQTHLEAIFQSVEDAIITVDNQMKVTQVNNAFESICCTSSILGNMVPQIRNKCSLRCWSVFEEALLSRNYIRDYRIECEHARNPLQIVLLNVTPLKDAEEKQIGGVMVIRDISRLSHLEKELQDRNQFNNIIGRSRKMQDVYNLIDNLKDMDTTILITGPSGTGKELIARAVHYSGVRAHKPFVVVNCSALTESLLESELFGHAKGAFTGAVKDKIGRFQLADHGTLFLDEIGDISPRIQVKLLRVLETREFERVGDPTPIKMDVQILSATNQDLLDKMRKDEFREDLYYRLKVVEIKVPPLRERREDTPLLVEHFISSFNKKFKKDITGISKEVEICFMEYDWPGNIRELMHVLEHAFVVCQKQIIEMDNLPPEMRENLTARYSHETRHSRKRTPLTREDISRALENTGWNKVQAARILGLSRPSLYQKMKDYNIGNPTEEV
jgi:two-component system, NtrC family, response regulator HydG